MADMFVAAGPDDAQISEERIEQLQPRTIAEALECMRCHLDLFYLARDSRAIFLRGYYTMTVEVDAAIHGTGDYTVPIFFDGEWVDAVAARFARLYFDSLKHPASKAWARAHALAGDEQSSVLQNLLLGINAHINYDLAFGLHSLIREAGDHRNPETLARRKFDHDQLNNVLMRCLPKIQQVLSREFGGGIRLFSEMFGKLDELLSFTGLRYYRDRVWNNTLALLAARNERERKKVELRLDWESLQVAEVIADGSLLNRAIWGVDGFLRRWRVDKPQLEQAGGIHARLPMERRLQRPF